MSQNFFGAFLLGTLHAILLTWNRPSTTEIKYFHFQYVWTGRLDYTLLRQCKVYFHFIQILQKDLIYYYILFLHFIVDKKKICSQSLRSWTVICLYTCIRGNRSFLRSQRNLFCASVEINERRFVTYQWLQIIYNSKFYLLCRLSLLSLNFSPLFR
jgi:hypothetical protein